MKFVVAILLVAAPAFAQRLPATVTPIHYDIHVAPDLAAATFTGEETIRVRIGQRTRTIVLNAAEIVFKDVTVTAGGRTQKAAVALDEKTEQATFSVPTAVAAGEASIRISYAGILNDDLRGLYLSHANNRRYAVTQLEATDARRMFPSFDEPAFKATFALKATIDAKDSAISNGAIVSEAPGPAPGKRTITFATTPKMSTYLVALAVGDFECNAGEADGIPIRICATPDKKKLTGFALESAKQIVEYFNRYYSIKYPFKKLDVVAVPDFAAGAMENTAAIFYRETLLLADENASVGVRRDIASVLAHEIAHQWFGNIVTMQWWNDLWLNEGFATWAQSKPVKAWKPEWRAELAEVRDTDYAMNLDSLSATRAIRTDARTPQEINELFDPIAYEKGAAIVRMIEAWVGEQDFQRGVNAYLEQFQYANARAEDFWGTLTKVTGKPVDKVMSAFVTQPGVPLVDVDVRCAGSNAAQLSQQRYVRDGGTPAGQQWHIPVCVKTAEGRAACDVLDHKSEPLALTACPSWVMGNAGARGYYRTALAPEALRRIAADVEKLTPAERMILVADEWALVRAGRHTAASFLDLASGFKDERTAAVIQTLSGPLQQIGEDLVTAQNREAYRRWLRDLFRPALADIGWGSPSDDDERRSLRAGIVGLLGNARDPEVMAKARELVDREMKNAGSVDATLLNAVLGFAAREGDAELYRRYLERSQAAVDPEERYRYLYALADFADPKLVRDTMALVLSDRVRSQDAKIFIANMLGNEDARELVWTLVRENWSAIQKKTGESVGNTIVVNALAMFCDPAHRQEIKTFFATHPVPDAERTLQQTLERVGSCAAFAEAQRGHVGAWLAKH